MCDMMMMKHKNILMIKQSKDDYDEVKNETKTRTSTRLIETLKEDKKSIV